jgi:DNA-binding XRE family transcriptional regulator
MASIAAFEKLGLYRRLCLKARPAADEAPMRRLAAAVRRARAAVGLSRDQAASSLGIDLEVLVAVENGYGDLPTSRRVLRGVRRLARAARGSGQARP